MKIMNCIQEIEVTRRDRVDCGDFI